MIAIAFFVIFVLVLSALVVLAHRLSTPRVLFEVAMEEHQWAQIRSFWQSLGRLQ
jgi:hypothetical protein